MLQNSRKKIYSVGIWLYATRPIIIILFSKFQNLMCYISFPPSVHWHVNVSRIRLRIDLERKYAILTVTIVLCLTPKSSESFGRKLATNPFLFATWEIIFLVISMASHA